MKCRILFLSLIFLLSSTPVHARELLDRVVAVVNNDPITQSELDMLLRPVYDQYRMEYKDRDLVLKLNDARQKLLNQLIEDRLVYQEAVSEGLEADPVEVERSLEQFKKRFSSALEMEQVLQAQGITLKQVRERFEKQAMIQMLHNREIRSQVVVSPKDVEDYYYEHPDKFTRASRLKIRSITIKKSYEARDKGIPDEEAKNRIFEIRARILTGEDFAALAREYSEDVQSKNGGLSDWIEEGKMIAQVNDVIFGLKLGAISEVIETPMGYHLFRVEEKEKGHKRSLEDARQEIQNELYQIKMEERFREWMQDLKRNAYISIR